jgi:hypothetical protein
MVQVAVEYGEELDSRLAKVDSLTRMGPLLVNGSCFARNRSQLQRNLAMVVVEFFPMLFLIEALLCF